MTPLLGLFAGIALLAAGVLAVVFARVVTQFVNRIFAAFVSQNYADRWATADRTSAIGVVFGCIGLFAVVSASVMLVSPSSFGI